jgi:hypothetical protein
MHGGGGLDPALKKAAKLVTRTQAIQFALARSTSAKENKPKTYNQAHDENDEENRAYENQCHPSNLFEILPILSVAAQE